jgi:hypothetical protein
MTKKNDDPTTVCITNDVWCIMNSLKRNPRESPNDVFREAILLLQEKRKNGV